MKRQILHTYAGQFAVADKIVWASGYYVYGVTVGPQRSGSITLERRPDGRWRVRIFTGFIAYTVATTRTARDGLRRGLNEMCNLGASDKMLIASEHWIEV